MNTRLDAEDAIAGSPLDTPETLLPRIERALDRAYLAGVDDNNDASYESGIDDGRHDGEFQGEALERRRVLQLIDKLRTQVSPPSRYDALVALKKAVESGKHTSSVTFND